MSTPLITPIKGTGGTFYTFPSASEDFNISMAGNSNKKFKFSKFVLLDIPDIKSATTGINTLGIDHIPSSYIKIDSSDWNTALAESFQNYCLNFETLLISQTSYDSKKNRTVSERVFWKWLKEMGTLRWREANVGNPEDGGERTRRTEDSLVINDINKRQEIGKRFVEEDESDTYDKVTKYIGSIDIVNGVKYQGSSFLELYFMIPIEVGNTPTVLFKSLVNDDNYKSDTILVNNPESSLNKEYLVGRAFSDSHPNGLDLRAHYDSDNASFTKGTSGVDSYSLSIKKYGEDSYTDGWWFSNPESNSYRTEPTRLNDPRNDSMKITGYRNSISNDKEFLRSRLDGVVIDFDLARSYSYNLTGTYKTFEDYNKSNASTDFNFNAILVYYDLEDLNNPTDSTTNLFGVLFLDKVKDTLTTGASIERKRKYKPNAITRQNGNAYGWKLNLKFDLNANDAVVVNSVNEYNNFSMHLFLEALESLRNATDALTTNLADIQVLKSKIDELEDLVLTSENVESLIDRINDLEQSLLASSDIISSSDSILDLINRNYQEILNIYKNFTSVEMSYNIDVLRSGRGIELDRSIPGIVRVLTKNSTYSLKDSSIITFDKLLLNGTNNYLYHNHGLVEGSNYLKILGNNANLKTDVITLVNKQKLIIFIDDSSISWVKGQSFKLVIGHEYQFNMTLNKAISIYTDSKNLVSSKDGPYSVEIASLTPIEVQISGGIPIIEVTCLDPDSMTFTYDILR